MKKKFVVVLFLVFSLCSTVQSEKLFPPHPWWQPMPPQIVYQAFDQGRQWQMDGVQRLQMDYGLWATRSINSDITFIYASMTSPLLDYEVAGWSAESEMQSDAEIVKTKSLLAMTAKPDKIEFSVFLTSEDDIDAFKLVSFALETDKGVRLEKLKMARPNTSVGHTTRSSWYNAQFSPAFKLNNEQITPETKWLRLWTIYQNSKISMTFSIDGTGLIQCNNDRPVVVPIPHK